MRSKRTRIGLVPVVLAILSVTLLGGCAHGDPAALGMFVADLFRNATAALLL